LRSGTNFLRARYENFRILQHAPARMAELTLNVIPPQSKKIRANLS
jgi:hypothetical protein